MGRIRNMWQSGIVGKVVLSIAGVFALLVVCCLIILVLPQKPRTVVTGATDVNVVASTDAPLPTDAPTQTDAPTPTFKSRQLPTWTPAPTAESSPTETEVPTDTPEPTVITNPKGVAPVDGDCPAHYRIKISKSGVAHDLESGSYSRTTPVHCYASMKDATDAGYTPAGD